MARHIYIYIYHHSEAEVTSYIDQLNKSSGTGAVNWSVWRRVVGGSGREFDGRKPKVREATG